MSIEFLTTDYEKIDYELKARTLGHTGICRRWMTANGRLRPVVTGSSRPIGGINSLLILGYSIHEARSRPTQQLSPIFFPAFLRSCVVAAATYPDLFIMRITCSSKEVLKRCTFLHDSGCSRSLFRVDPISSAQKCTFSALQSEKPIEFSGCPGFKCTKVHLF